MDSKGDDAELCGPKDDLEAVLDAPQVIDVADVGPDRGFGAVEFLGDLRMREPPRDRLDDLPLAAAESGRLREPPAIRW